MAIHQTAKIYICQWQKHKYCSKAQSIHGFVENRHSQHS